MYGRGRCVLAALLEPVACRAGGYHGMAVWPDYPPRDDLAAHEVQHLNHLVPRSSSRVELLLQLPKRVLRNRLMHSPSPADRASRPITCCHLLLQLPTRCDEAALDAIAQHFRLLRGLCVARSRLWQCWPYDRRSRGRRCKVFMKRCSATLLGPSSTRDRWTDANQPWRARWAA